MNRRPLTSRGNPWAVSAAKWLARVPVRPNHISLASMVFACGAGLSLLFADSRAEWYLAAAVMIQLRLLCNLMDGMVAIEGALQSKSGEIYNDLPDRISDAIILILAGYSLSWPAWSRELGWSAALLAVMTAYARVLGGASGLVQDFSGPMAKPHRMAVLTAGCIGAAAESFIGASPRSLAIALGVIVIGSAATMVRRTARIVQQLESRSS
ncbi:MAG: CDP-alcohol phosphatidyltransferase family protein [Bryobacteraceae bacterium]